MSLRPASLSYFTPTGRSVIRGQNFTVDCLRGSIGSTFDFASTDETILICAENGAVMIMDGKEIDIPARSLVIAPSGTMALIVPDGGCVFALTTGRSDPAPGEVVNAALYEQPDGRVAPVGAPMSAAGGNGKSVRIFPVDDIPFPKGNPRLKFLQSATMSINWVEYEGARDRTKLSPHAHSDFEQGSLAIAGRFVHHIRTPWGSDATTWRDDDHIGAGANSMLIIPPELIHTTEGEGAGRHILIDVFAPARADFIDKGWVHNSADYSGQATRAADAS